MRWQILDAAGRTVATTESLPQKIAAQGSATFLAQTRFNNPRLWSPEMPDLYVAMVTIESGNELRDAERVRFGVRTVAFDTDKQPGQD